MDDITRFTAQGIPWAFTAVMQADGSGVVAIVFEGKPGTYLAGPPMTYAEAIRRTTRRAFVRSGRMR